MKVAIIGTAGRDKGMPYTLDLYADMVEDARKRFTDGKEYNLVSGGAAWADHLAVELFLLGKAKTLTLHLPAIFHNCRFVGPANSAASAANYYHECFTKTTGIDSRREIQQAIENGATITEQPSAPGYGAMFARNNLVAADAEACLAYTWGEGPEPKEGGGTRHTWDKINGRKVHVPLITLVQ